MAKESITWFLVVAFLMLIVPPGPTGAETVPSTQIAPAADEAEVSSSEASASDNNAGTPVFSVRESLQLAQAEGTLDAARDEAALPRDASREPAAVNEPKREGLSAGVVVGIVVVGVVLAALAVAAAAASGRGGGGFSGVKLNFGK